MSNTGTSERRGGRWNTYFSIVARRRKPTLRNVFRCYLNIIGVFEANPCQDEVKVSERNQKKF